MLTPLQKQTRDRLARSRALRNPTPVAQPPAVATMDKPPTVAQFTRWANEHHGTAWLLEFLQFWGFGTREENRKAITLLRNGGELTAQEQHLLKWRRMIEWAIAEELLYESETEGERVA